MAVLDFVIVCVAIMGKPALIMNCGKRFQHLHQHAFNTVVEPNFWERLNMSFNIVESVKSVARFVESVLNKI